MIWTVRESAVESVEVRQGRESGPINGVIKPVIILGNWNLILGTHWEFSYPT